MSSLTISLITVCYNAAGTIENCLNSVFQQDYPHVEYIVVDGRSTDGTTTIIEQYSNQISCYISEPDEGMYDALNKGINVATGDVIGILNADDRFHGNNILSQVAQAFKTSKADIIYGDINYVNRKNKIIRKWRSGTYKKGAFNWGWMPPHPTFYAKRLLFKEFGAYRTLYGTAADYELMLRYMHVETTIIKYLNKVMVNMLTGGISNKNAVNRVKAWMNDYSAMKNNNIKFPYLSVFLKPVRKIVQYMK